MKHIIEIIEVEDIWLISLKDVIRITGVSRATIYRWMNLYYFPKSVAIGPNSIRFRLRDVRFWCEDPVKWRKENATDI